MSDQFDKQRFLTTLTSRPGIYRMLDATGHVLYVGKARDLKKRVASYFGSKAHHPKTQALMSHTTRMDVTVTATEQEALLLEYNLIKAHEPRFNVLLRDGKSYPYIRVTLEQEFPRFEFHRGKRVRGSRYFGPFPSAGAVRQTLGQLQKLFMVRQCQDSYFANRSRPCLQHQIKRCTAPCVNLIERDDYQRDVDNAVLFLSGQDEAVVADLISRMESASEAKIYEQAALFRDQIKTIREVQARQSVSGENLKDADVAYVYELHGAYCIAVIMIRGGRMLGGRNFFPRVTAHTEIGEVLSAFLMHHYFAQAAPPEIMLNVAPEHRKLLEEAFAERAGHGVHIKTSVRGHRRRWLDIAGTNAREALKSSQAYNASTVAQLESIGDVL
jgi:excinuclease ABC subunit C